MTHDHPHKTRLRRTFLAAFLGLAMAFSSGCSWLRDDVPMEGVEAAAGDLRVEAAFEPDPPKEKGNELLLAITDAEGQPVDDADVSVVYQMPAMGSMPEMKGEADVKERGDGRYVASFDLPMGGSWNLIVDVKAENASGQARYSMTVGTKGLRAEKGAGGKKAAAESSVTAPAPTELPPEALSAAQAAFAAYEEVRVLLASDSLEGLDAAANRIASELETAKGVLQGASPEVAGCLDEAVKAANALAAASEIEQARKDFGEVSRYLVALATADERLQEGWHIFECPMAPGFQKWMQRPSEIQNPYMGQKMLTCGSDTEWSVAVKEQAPAHDGHAHGGGDGDGDEIAYYTCSMHPSVKQDAPGTCPICAMDTTPVTKAELESGTLFVDDVRRQKIGVKTAPVERRTESRQIRALGKVLFDETKVEDVTIRVSGFIEELMVDETGQLVKKGDTLFTLYSPELYAAQVEYLQALKLANNTKIEGLGDLAVAAKKRLRLWELSEGQIRRIARRGKPLDALPIASPATGHVIEKHVNKGSEVQAGQLAYRIAALDEVWIEAEIYENDLALLEEGQAVTVTLPYEADKQYEGTIAFIQPVLDDESRVGKVRVELQNEDLALKPNMYANVIVDVDAAEGLWVPASAVVYTGKRRLVFVDLGDGRLKPQEVKLGARSDGYFQVTGGLDQGDVVVTSGNFLIAAESRIRNATEYWANDDEKEASE